jgi:dienelactone hydrolase
MNERKIMTLKILAVAVAAFCIHASAAMAGSALPTPPDVWAGYDPDAGDFKEEVVREETKDGVYYRDTYISAYVNGEEIRVFCMYGVKADATNAPGLLNIHGWMARANLDRSYINDGWAVMSFDYCGQVVDRENYTKYPESLRHCNMDKSVSGGTINSQLQDGSSITDPRQTSDYVWYVLQRRVLSYLLSQKQVDPNRIGAKGYSYGGSIIWNLGMDPRVKAIVTYFGVGFLEYYRTRGVWMYSVPHHEPEKTPGEALYLSAVAPEAHAPFIRAATLWLNGSNDHHGGHERGEQIFTLFQPGVPWAFAIQARGHHDTEKLGDNCRLWLEKHVLGRDVDWPARPRSEIVLDEAGVPELRVTPDQPGRIEELKAYYALKEPVSFGRVWRDAETVREGDTWLAKMPVINVDDYVFGFANIRYAGNIVISTDFNAVIPSSLGSAVATDEPSADLSGSTALWSDVAPAEVGGIEGFRPLNNQRGTVARQFNDPKWKAPSGAVLSLQFYCTQPQSLIIEVNDRYVAELEITAAEGWQTMVIKADALKQTINGAVMRDWSDAASIRIKPKPGEDITKVVFANVRWAAPVKEQPVPDKDGRVYLSTGFAAGVDSFWRVMQDRGVEGKPISVGGTTYERGLGVHADSRITYDLEGQYASMHVVPGPDDAHRGQMAMKVLVDDAVVYDSGAVQSAGFTPEPLNLSLIGAQTLTLVVESLGDRGGDHACWADAYLVPAKM